MKVIRNSIIPFCGFSAINLFGVLFVRKGVTITPRLLRHELIHTAQLKETLYIFFYLLYFFEWIVRLFEKRSFKDAYHAVSLEQEAFSYDDYPTYLEVRDRFAWVDFL